MATFRKHRTAGGEVRWTATVRKLGHAVTRTWGTRREAEEWERDVEAAISRATPAAPFVAADWLPQKAVLAPAVEADVPSVRWTLRQALERYRVEVTTRKKGRVQEAKRIKAWLARPMADKPLEGVTAGDLQAHADARLAAGRGAATVRLELVLLSALFRHAACPVRGWGLLLANPVTRVLLPSPPDPRERRLLVGEEERLLAAAAQGAGADDMADIIVAAIHTGMRRSELLDLRAGQVVHDAAGWVVRRPDSKNGRPRTVYLDASAQAVLLRRMKGLGVGERVFAPLTSDLVERRWEAAIRRSGVRGLRFHDLRHEAISRWMDAGFSVAEIGAQSGQRSAQVLLGYAKARPANIVGKLNGAQEE